MTITQVLLSAIHGISCKHLTFGSDKSNDAQSTSPLSLWTGLNPVLLLCLFLSQLRLNLVGHRCPKWSPPALFDWDTPIPSPWRPRRPRRSQRLLLTKGELGRERQIVGGSCRPVRVAGARLPPPLFPQFRFPVPIACPLRLRDRIDRARSGRTRRQRVPTLTSFIRWLLPPVGLPSHSLCLVTASFPTVTSSSPHP